LIFRSGLTQHIDLNILMLSGCSLLALIAIRLFFCRAHANGNPSELINEPMLLAKMLFTFCQCDWPIPVSSFSILLPGSRSESSVR
jgi:hypothetical protein